MLLDDSSPAALLIDTAPPASAPRLHTVLVDAWPRLAGRVVVEQRSVASVALQSDDLVVASHACGAPADAVLDSAVAEAYRGSGIFDGRYRAMANIYGDRYDFTITEVAARNTRSLRAHARVGFRTLHVYPDTVTTEEWHVLVVDLNGSGGC